MNYREIGTCWTSVKSHEPLFLIETVYLLFLKEFRITNYAALIILQLITSKFLSFNTHLLSEQVIDFWHKRKKIKSLAISVRQGGLGKNHLMICWETVFQLMTFLSVSRYHHLNRRVPRGKDKYMKGAVRGHIRSLIRFYL